MAERKRASDFPKEVLALFDGYIHGFIDRRAFLEGAAKVVGGGTAIYFLDYAYIVGFPVAFVVYYVLMKTWILKACPQAEVDNRDKSRFLATSVGMNWVWTGDRFERFRTADIPESYLAREDR